MGVARRSPFSPLTGLRCDCRAPRPPLSHGGASWNPRYRAGLVPCVLPRETHAPLAPTRTQEAPEIYSSPGPFRVTPRGRVPPFFGQAFFAARFTLAVDCPSS
jgi:hypothetical protein